MKYYRLMDELNKPLGRWFLKGLDVVEENKISVWRFLTPEQLKLPDAQQLSIKIREEGKPLDFTFADFEVIIVNERFKPLLSDIECQLIPIKIEGVKNTHNYFVAIILNSVNCLDESKSNFEKWQIDDPVRPDLAGTYKTIYKLLVDPYKIGADNKIFRLGRSENIIIVNSEFKEYVEKNGFTGVKFKEVS